MSPLQIPPAVQGPFFAAVWKIVSQVPPGKVTTYGHISKYIPCPQGVSPEEYRSAGARWVGNAMAACPGNVPWQRVINSQGKISIRSGEQGTAAAEHQRRLLENEGVIFDSSDRVNLALYGWQGPQQEWLVANGLLVPEEPQQPSLF